MGLVLLSALASAPSDGAELFLRGVRWEMGVRVKAAPLRYAPVEAWRQGPGEKLPGRARVQVTVENGGREPVEGVVVRFALSAKIAPAGGGKGVWAVPFELGERRIPRLRGNEIKTVPLQPNHIVNYLRRLHSRGFWPEEFKIQVMLDPKSGDDLASNFIESLVPVKR